MAKAQSRVKQGLEKGKAWRLYDLEKRGIITSEESREMAGGFLIDKTQKSMDPNEDRFEKIRIIDNF